MDEIPESDADTLRLITHDLPLNGVNYSIHREMVRLSRKIYTEDCWDSIVKSQGTPRKEWSHRE